MIRFFFYFDEEVLNDILLCILTFALFLASNKLKADENLLPDNNADPDG